MEACNALGKFLMSSQSALTPPADAPMTIISRFGVSMDKVLTNQSRLERYQALTVYSDRFLYRRTATSSGLRAKLVAGPLIQDGCILRGYISVAE